MQPSYPAARTLAGWGLLLLALVVALGIVGLAVASPVAAQAGNVPPETTAADGGNETAECTEHIDRFVSLCSATVQDGIAVLELDSEANQRIVLTDAGGVMQGGEVTREQFVIRGRSTVRMPVTEYDGMSAVTIDTGRVLYAIPLERPDSWFQGDANWSTAQFAGAGGTIGALVVVGAIAWRRRDGGREEVTRRS